MVPDEASIAARRGTTKSGWQLQLFYNNKLRNRYHVWLSAILQLVVDLENPRPAPSVSRNRVVAQLHSLWSLQDISFLRMNRVCPCQILVEIQATRLHIMSAAVYMPRACLYRCLGHSAKARSQLTIKDKSLPSPSATDPDIRDEIRAHTVICARGRPPPSHRCISSN